MSADMLVRCAECEVDFLWTPGEQASGIRPTQCPVCQRIAPPPGRERGLVKWFSRAKGYGFITSVGGDDLFVHKSGLAAGQPLLRVGQLVEFALTSTRRGVQAIDVRALEMGDGG